MPSLGTDLTLPKISFSRPNGSDCFGYLPDDPQEMCSAALAHRLAQRLIKERAAIREALVQFDHAVAHAKRNQYIYQINYEDDYDWTDGLCSTVTERLEKERADFLSACSAKNDLNQSIPESARACAQAPVLFLPWEPQEDILPPHRKEPGLFLSTKIGFVDQEDYFRLGVVFTVEVQNASGDWKPIFRRGLMRRTRGWEQWNIPLEDIARQNTGQLRLRFVTDSYTRAQDRNAPTWKWALWGQPQLIRTRRGGKPEVIYDFAQHVDQARSCKRLDEDGLEHPFDAPGEDATGAIFKLLGPDATARKILQIQEQSRDLQWIAGFRNWAQAHPIRVPIPVTLGKLTPAGVMRQKSRSHGKQRPCRGSSQLQSYLSAAPISTRPKRN